MVCVGGGDAGDGVCVGVYAWGWCMHGVCDRGGVTGVYGVKWDTSMSVCTTHGQTSIPSLLWVSGTDLASAGLNMEGLLQVSDHTGQHSFNTINHSSN